jgi:RimJ/RimL family protein N-acetyltransferase
MLSDITPKYVESLNDQNVMKFTESRGIFWDLRKLKTYVNYQGVDSILMGIFLEGHHIGSVRIHSINKKNSRCDLGILIFDTNYWNQGIGSKALRLAADYIFKELNLNKISANYFENNLASAKLFQRLGFRKIGQLEDHFKISEDSFQNAIIVELLRKNHG